MNFFYKVHNESPFIGVSYMMLDITGLDIGDFIASSPELISGLSVIGKFSLALISAYTARKIDNHFKMKEIEAEKKKR